MSFSGGNLPQSRFVIDRPTYEQTTLDLEYGFHKPNRQSRKDQLRASCHCSTTCVWAKFTSLFPILSWLPEYSWRKNLLSDIIAGITVAFMHIPQGLAYATVASVPLKNGLFTSFFPSLIYMFLGTSKQNSQGTFAVIALMIGEVSVNIQAIFAAQPRILLNYTIDTIQAQTQNTPVFVDDVLTIFNETQPIETILGLDSRLDEQYSYEQPLPTALEIVTVLTLAIGLCQLLMAIFRLHFLTSYLSDVLISGFTTAAACHVFTAQVNQLLNISFDRQTGYFAIIRSYQNLLANIPNTGYMTLAFSIVIMSILVIGKEFVNPIVKERYNIPLPWELIVIILGTLVSELGYFNENFGTKIVGPIPAGFAGALTIPRLELLPVAFADYMSGAISIGLIIFAFNISLAKLFARKHDYSIDPHQELYALGVMQLIGSFTGCFAATPALARSTVYEQAGARSQLAILFTTMVMFCVLMWMAPWLYSLPTCVLSAVIIVALKSMFRQLNQLPFLWDVSKIEFFIWLFSFCATLLLGVRDGLLLSIAFASTTLLIRNQISESTLLRRLKDTDIFAESNSYYKTDDMPHLVVFRFNAPLVFTNVESFRQQALRAAQSLQGTAKRFQRGSVSSRLRIMTRHAKYAQVFIIDCSSIGYADLQGLNAIQEIYKDISKLEIRVAFASINADLRRDLHKIKFFSSLPSDVVFPAINDVVAQYEI